MDPKEVAKVLEGYGFHVETVTPIERGHRIVLKESAFVDIISSEIIFYYRKKVDCKFLELYRQNIKANMNEILNRGYVVGFDIHMDECYLVIIKKIKDINLENLWNEYLNMIKIASMALKNPS